jgi:hypothetical protein
MTHDGFCMMPREACYLFTCICLCHGEVVSRERQARSGVRPAPVRKDATCRGLEAGSTANGVCNLIWLAVLLGAVIYAIVSLA